MIKIILEMFSRKTPKEVSMCSLEGTLSAVKCYDAVVDGGPVLQNNAIMEFKLSDPLISFNQMTSINVFLLFYFFFWQLMFCCSRCKGCGPKCIMNRLIRICFGVFLAFTSFVFLEFMKMQTVHE